MKSFNTASSNHIELEESYASSQPDSNTKVKLTSPIKIFNVNNGILTLDTAGLESYKQNANLTMRSSPNRAVRHFYEMQEAFLGDLIELSSDNGDTEKQVENHQSCAVTISFGCNIALLVIKLLATIVTGSLAMLASTVDSFLDIPIIS